MRIGLGTAQFGLDYGISNAGGKTSSEEVPDILAAAMNGGVRLIDTAAGYGTSEEVLGRSWPPEHAFEVVTKTPVFRAAAVTVVEADILESTITRSLVRLRLPSCYGLLIHHAGDLLVEGGERLWERMDAARRAGRVAKIGVSVYEAGQLDAILDRYPIDLVQVPLNVFDQRLIASGHLRTLKEEGVEVHARSVFLQGLLVMDGEAVPSYFDPIRKALRRYHADVSRLGLTRVEAALGFVAGIPEVDAAVIGVNARAQLEEVLAAAVSLPTDLFSEYALRDEAMLDPSRWAV